MAYYIDEAGKRGLKAEGKQFFAWDFDARKFVSPVDDAPPKSRMRRCTEFEAKKFNFDSAETDWTKRIDYLLDAAKDFSDDQLSEMNAQDIAGLRKQQEAAEKFSDKWLPKAREAVAATQRYGVENSDIGRLASDVVASIQSNVKLPSVLIQALEAGESAKLKFKDR